MVSSFFDNMPNKRKQNNVKLQSRVLQKKRTPTEALRPRFRSRVILLVGMVTILTTWAGALMLFMSKTNANLFSKDPPSMMGNRIDDNVAREIPGLQLSISTPSDGHSDLEVVLPSNLPSYFGDDSGPRGVVLLLHACTHSAFKFFSLSNVTCPDCVGLSEELQIVRLVLEKGYIPVALSCVDRKSGCWNPLIDTKRIEYLLQWLKQNDDETGVVPSEQFRKLVAKSLSSSDSKVHVIGASSGGTMAAHLVANRIMDAGIVMVMGLGPKLASQLKELHQQSKRPKLYLAPMPRDKGTTQRAIQNYQALCTNCPTAEKNNPPSSTKSDWVVLDTTRCDSLPLTVAFLMQRVPGMNVEAATMLIEVLREANHMDNDTQLLIVDPTKSNWRDLLLEKEAQTGAVVSSNAFYHGKFALQPGYSPLAKALHRSWAFHEYCSEVVIPALEFFEEG